MDDMTKEEFDAEIQKGFDDVADGRVKSAAEVFSDIRRSMRYKILVTETTQEDISNKNN